MENTGASVVITHNIKEGKQPEYENWLTEIGPICRSFVGNINWQIIRPIPNLTFKYTIIIQFDTIDNLKNWMQSNERMRLIKKVTPILSKEDNYYIKSGLDFLFESENDKQKPPVRWKQYLVTWSAIFPLSIVVPLIVLPFLHFMNFPENHYLNSFLISGIIVFLMVYLIMPYYTKLIKKWLFK
ncbi:MAG: antibiotic biosynthesis monooxygenase [Bacteroidota bacterium]